MTPAQNRARILSDAARRLDHLARAIDDEWPTLRWHHIRDAHAVAHGQGTPPPFMVLDEHSERAQAIGEVAHAYVVAAATQYALPYFTSAGLRAQNRRERNTFTQATHTFRGMTDWYQTRGQSREARLRAGLRRSWHFHRAIFSAIRRSDYTSPHYVARERVERGWDLENATA